MYAEGKDGMRPEIDAWFVDLYARRYGAVHAYACRRVGADAAADAAAEVFLVAWRRGPQLAPEHELPWLYATARRVTANMVRSDARSTALCARLAFNTLDETAAGGTDPFEKLDTSLAVHRSLMTLSTNDREVLMLVTWEDLDIRAAAKTLGCTTTAFRVRLHRARKRFRAVWDAQYHEQHSGEPAISTALPADTLQEIT